MGGLAQLKPDVLDKIDFDQVVDDLGGALGVNPKIIVPDNVVAALREQRAQAAQAQQAAAAMPAMVDAAKTAGDINMQGVQDVMTGLQGYGTVNGAMV